MGEHKFFAVTMSASSPGSVKVPIASSALAQYHDLFGRLHAFQTYSRIVESCQHHRDGAPWAGEQKTSSGRVSTAVQAGDWHIAPNVVCERYRRC